MPGRRFAVACLVLILFVVSDSAVAQTKRKAVSKAARSVIGQNVVVPSCGGPGDELKEPTTLWPDAAGHLSTTFDVVQEPRTVPVYTQNAQKEWVCTETTFDLRLYKDPVSGVPKFPGPTLRLKRATETRPGDKWSILLRNYLPASDERCVWAKGNCPNCDSASPPQCCNATTEPNGMNCMHGDNTTNLHFHGTHVSPQRPQDWVLLQLTPFAGTKQGGTMHGDAQNTIQGEFQYAVNRLPKNQAEGTHWYHPHKHGSTAEQVGNGMAGALIITGPFDEWLRSPAGGNLPNLREKTLVVQNIHSLNFTSTDGGINPIVLINGQLTPQITMYRGEIQRWRFVNANIDADSQLVIDFDGLTEHAVTPKAMQIAMDGVQFSPRNYRCQPMLDQRPCPEGTLRQPQDLKFMFSPGNRADFLLQAPNAIGEFFVPYEVFGAIDEQGTRPRRDPRATRNPRQVKMSSMRAALDAVAPGSSQPALLSISVIDCPPGMNCRNEFPGTLPDLPEFLRPITPDPRRTVEEVQFQVLTSTGQPSVPPNPAPTGVFAIRVKGKNDNQPMQFDDHCAVFTEPLDPNGGVEWVLSQNGKRADGTPPKPFHVFHIHINPFQVVSTFDLNGNPVVYPEPIWQDSITLPNNTNPTDPDKPSTWVRIRQRFGDYTGTYVLHCHFLGHEDRGMMLAVQTVCPNDLGSISETSADKEECTFDKFLPALPPCGRSNIFPPFTTTAASTHSH